MEDAPGILSILVPVVVLVIAFGPPLVGLLIGRYIEKAHLRDLDEAEAVLRTIPVTDTDVSASKLGVTPGGAVCVVGSVVIAPDAFRGMLSRLRLLIGGEMRWYGQLLARGRREALCRLLKQAHSLDAQAVVNVRMEVSSISFWDMRRPPMLEVIAYGTAVLPGDEGAALEEAVS
ncbi:MAG: heavy metal-binding domain-containing protein [Candidatus Hydrogenedentota bacterium]